MNRKPQAATGATKVSFTAHFRAQLAAKGLDPRAVIEALKAPYKITPVTRYPGQWRYCGGGVAVVTKPEGDTLTCITVYLDGVRTPLRADQMNDPAALASRRALR